MITVLLETSTPQIIVFIAAESNDMPRHILPKCNKHKILKCHGKEKGMKYGKQNPKTTTPAKITPAVFFFFNILLKKSICLWQAVWKLINEC